MAKDKECTAEITLKMLVHTAKEQFVLSGQGAEPIVDDLVGVMETLMEAGEVSSRSVKMAKETITMWKEEESKVKLPQPPKEEEIKASICWLMTFCRVKKNQSYRKHTNFIKITRRPYYHVDKQLAGKISVSCFLSRELHGKL